MNGVTRKCKPPIQLIQSPQTKSTLNRTDPLLQLLMAYKMHPSINIWNQLSIRYPSNGRRIIAAENITNDNNSNGNNDAIIITYDHLDNPLWLGHSSIKHLIKKVLVAWNHYGCILQSDVFYINTGSRRFIDKTSRKQEQIHWDAWSSKMSKPPPPHYQRYPLKWANLAWDSACGIKSMYATHS